jgi:hypothetical protein
MRANDSYIRDMKNRTDTTTFDKWKTGIMRQGLPMAELQGIPQYDWWGRPATKGESPLEGGPTTDFVWRMVVPIAVQKAVTPENVDRMIFNWNRSQAGQDDQYWPGLPKDTYQYMNQVTKMTDAEYEQFQKLSGAMALARLKTARLNFDNPTKYDIGIVRRVFNEARDAARIQIRNIRAVEQQKRLLQNAPITYRGLLQAG